jgi:hypothetical protein
MFLDLFERRKATIASPVSNPETRDKLDLFIIASAFEFCSKINSRLYQLQAL